MLGLMVIPQFKRRYAAVMANGIADNVPMLTKVRNSALIFVLAFVVATFSVFAINRTMDTGLQILIFLLLMAPSVILALTKSPYLVPYTVFLWVISPEIRRYVDWYEGVYHSMSLFSILPEVGTLLIVVTYFGRKLEMPRRVRKLIGLIAICFLYALAIGFLRYRTSALVELSVSIFPLILIPYVFSQKLQSQNVDMWIRSIVNAAVFVSAYGWYQFTTAPAWDAFWMNNAQMASIGSPIPLHIRVFSTLNSPGPTSMFLAVALMCALADRKWRGRLGILKALLIASCLAITLVRTAWIFVLLGILSWIFLSPGNHRWRMISVVCVCSAVAYYSVPHLPGFSTILQRSQTFTSLGTDHSMLARIGFSQTMLVQTFHQFFGHGLGATGTSTKSDNGGAVQSLTGNFDNGYLDILYTYGIVVGVVFLISEWKLMSTCLGRSDKYARLVKSLVLPSLMALMSNNILGGVAGFFLWLIISVGMRVPDSI